MMHPSAHRLQSSRGLSRGAFVMLIIYYDRVCPCMHFVGPYQTVSLAFYYNVASRVPALRRSVPGYGVARAHVPFPTSVWTVTWSASAQTSSAFPRQDTGSFAIPGTGTVFDHQGCMTSLLRMLTAFESVLHSFMLHTP